MCCFLIEFVLSGMRERKDPSYLDASKANEADISRNRIAAMSKRHDSKFRFKLLTHKELYPPIVDSNHANFWNMLSSNGATNAVSTIGVNWHRFEAEHLEQQALSDHGSMAAADDNNSSTVGRDQKIITQRARDNNLQKNALSFPLGNRNNRLGEPNII